MVKNKRVKFSSIAVYVNCRERMKLLSDCFGVPIRTVLDCLLDVLGIPDISMQKDQQQKLSAIRIRDRFKNCFFNSDSVEGAIMRKQIKEYFLIHKLDEETNTMKASPKEIEETLESLLRDQRMTEYQSLEKKINSEAQYNVFVGESCIQ
jgi:hypothetical protein